MSYISELQIDNGSILPIGSSLYGICSTSASTPAKEVTLANFDTLIHGVTVHVKFTNGNNVSTGPTFTLKVGSTDARVISNPGGSINWSAGAVVSFTYDETTSPGVWIANDSDSGQAITIQNTYSSSSTDAISGQGVADALDDLGDAAEKGVITTIVESGANANKTSTDLPTTNAIVTYVDGKLTGLTGAMHFVGVTTTTLVDDSTTATVIIDGSSFSPSAGDVVLSGDHKEYVWSGSKWELLGDEGSYALKTSTASVIKSTTFTKNTLPTLTITAVSIPNVTNAGTAPSLTTTAVTIPNVTNAGSAANFEVTSGVLKITKGSAPTLGTNITVQEVESWSAGSATTLGTAISVGSASGWNAGT